MSMITSITVLVVYCLVARAVIQLPRLTAWIIASVTGSVLIRCKRASDHALINRPPTPAGNRWQRSTTAERRLLRRVLRNTMRLTMHRSLFPDVGSI